jgi:hypothetical protein
MLSRIIVLRFLSLCGFTALVVAALWAYVKLMQPGPEPDAHLAAAVGQDILWPWESGQGAVLRLSFAPPPDAVPDPNPVRELALVLDASDSMKGRPLQDAQRAAFKFLDNLDVERGGIPVHVVRFDEAAQAVTPPDGDPAQARAALADLTTGGGTAFLPALRTTLGLLKSQGATVVMLTDGNAEPPEQLREFFENTWKPSGHALFLLGIGGGVNRDALAALTDEPDQFLITGLDQDAPDDLFQQTVEKLRTRIGRAVYLAAPWSAPLVGGATGSAPAPDGGCDPLPGVGTGSERFAIPALFARDRPYCWSAGFAPRMGGVLRVLHAPAKLDYIDTHGQPRSFRSQASSPLVLAVPWWLLLPALLYLPLQMLAAWLGPKKIFVPTPPLRPPPPPLPPSTLARRWVDPGLRTEWMPTLLIGLGGGGRRVLTQVAQALRDAIHQPGAAPLLLALEVARDEVEGPHRERVPGCLEALPAESVFLLPEAACRLQAQSRPADPDDLAALLSKPPYLNAATDLLSLRRGAQGDGVLARLALLRDLAEGGNSALLKRLRAALGAWRELPGGAQRRQIILVGNADGGMTRGWLSDLLILLRRLVEEDERGGTAVDISALLLGKPEVHDPACHPLRPDSGALFDELDRLACAGRLPFRHGWADAPAPLAEGWVERRPQDDLFVMSAHPDEWERQLYPNAADALLLLADSQRRRDLTGILETIRPEEQRRRIRDSRESYVEIALRGAAFPHSFQRRLIELRFLGLLLGQQVLFPGLAIGPDGASDLPPGSAGALPPPEPDQAAATAGLEQPLRLLAAGTIASLPARPAASATAASPGQPGGVDQATEVAEASLALFQWLQAEWTDQLRRGQWNLATLASTAQAMAGNLRRGGVPAAAEALEALAVQAIEWIALLLGSAVAQRAADSAGIPQEAPQDEGVLTRTGREYRGVREAYQEWQGNPTRLSVLPWQEGSDDALLQNWLRAWLGAAPDPNAELRRRCRFALAAPGPDGAAIGLVLDFTGTQAGRFPSARLADFLERVRAEVRDSLWPDMRQRFLDALARQLGENPAESAKDFAAKLRGELRGDRAVLLVSMPGADAAPGPEAERLRLALSAALKEDSGAAEILRFHEARDPFRFLLWRLQALKQTRPRAENPLRPAHPCERRRAEQGHRLGLALGRSDLRLPLAAGLALADYDRLVAFAGLWLAGLVRKDESSGLYRVAVPAGSPLVLTRFPEEGLAEAAARFVAGQSGLVPPADAPERDPAGAADPFESLLCLAWRDWRRAASR